MYINNYKKVVIDQRIILDQRTIETNLLMLQLILYTTASTA